MASKLPRPTSSYSPVLEVIGPLSHAWLHPLLTFCAETLFLGYTAGLELIL